MTDVRLAWEPVNQTPLLDIENRLKTYVSNESFGVSLLKNGTVITSSLKRNDLEDAKISMREAAYLTDFQIIDLDMGGFAVKFHPAISVFVGEREFESQKQEIQERITELMFPGEQFFTGKNSNKQRDLLIGLYGRGKLQYDAYNFCFYKRIEPT